MPGEQHDERERLGQVVVGAEVERVGLVVLAVLRRQHQDRHPVLGGAQLLDDPVAGQPRQHDVEDDRVVGGFLRHVQPVRAGVRDVDGEALVGQPALQRRREPDLVLDDQQSHGNSFVEIVLSVPPEG